MNTSIFMMQIQHRPAICDGAVTCARRWRAAFCCICSASQALDSTASVLLLVSLSFSCCRACAQAFHQLGRIQQIHATPTDIPAACIATSGAQAITLCNVKTTQDTTQALPVFCRPVQRSCLAIMPIDGDTKGSDNSQATLLQHEMLLAFGQRFLRKHQEDMP